MAKIQLKVVTPEREVVSEEVDELIAPGAVGLFGVRPKHAAFVTSVEPGPLTFKAGGTTHRYALGGGFIEVADDVVTVLADSAEAADEIDIERARRAEEDARRRLANLSQSDPAFVSELARVRRAAVRIKVATGH